MTNRIKLTFSNYLLVCIMMIFFTSISYAQESIQRIYDENEQSINLRSSVNIPDELLHGKNPTIYIKDASIINVTGDESPKVLKLLDATSSNILRNANNQYNDVEVITITLNRISDLNLRFDLSSINGFNSLRYIYIKCMFDCTDQQIRDFLLNADSVTTIFYKVINQS